MKKNKILEYIKEHKIIISFITLILVLLITGTTLAIYLKSGEGNEKKYTLANINVEYIDGDTIKAENAIPLTDYEIEEYAAKKEFKFRNTGDQTLYAEILLTEIEMDELLKSNNFRWELYEEDNQISSGSFVSVNDSNTLSLKKGIRVDVEDEPKNYKILVYIRDNGQDQNTMENKNMKAKVKVIATDKPTLYEDNSGANPPKLADGMIPVTYDEESDAWVKANLYDKWYDYDDGMWANAVTVYPEASTCGSNNSCVDTFDKKTREYYLNAEAGTPISMDDINSMWVWIPRYKYKIPSSLGIGTSKNIITNPPEIDVVFEKGLQATGVDEKVYRTGIKADGINENYYTHPAFRNGTKIYNTEEYDIGGWDAELTGIWVGKFETGGTSSQPIIKPDVVAINSGSNTKSKFEAALKFSGGIVNVDSKDIEYKGNVNYGLSDSTNSHMIKNTEWGAVAILSQSRYGKMENNNFDSSKKEVYPNSSTRVYTGRSYGDIADASSPESKIGKYSYNDYECLSNDSTKCTGEKVIGAGIGASTTGTIYGIYDMSGGSFEISMSTLNIDTIISSFSFEIPGKYFDLYKSDNPYILGDATWETKYWYSDGASFINNNLYPVRGCSFDLDLFRSLTGVFQYGDTSGCGYHLCSFRTVLIS